MKIYGSKAGNPVRVALFLAEKGLDIEFCPVDLLQGKHKEPEFVARNPFKEIPVLELEDGTCISETIAICRYIEAIHPEPNLLGRNGKEEAFIEMWQRRLEFNLYLPARAIFRHTSPHVKALEPVQLEAWADLNRTKIPESLAIIDNQLANNVFVAGDNYSVADITLLFCLEMLSRLEIPPEQTGSHINRWYTQVMQRPAVLSIYGQ